MFESYQLTPSSHIPNNSEEQRIILTDKPQKPLVSYNKFGQPVGLTWHRGDNICLELNTSGTVTYDLRDPEVQANQVDAGFYEVADQYLQNLYFEILICDFRYNIMGTCKIPAEITAKVYTRDFMDDLQPGIYYLNVHVVNAAGELQQAVIERCQIFIK